MDRLVGTGAAGGARREGAKTLQLDASEVVLCTHTARRAQPNNVNNTHSNAPPRRFPPRAPVPFAALYLCARGWGRSLVLAAVAGCVRRERVERHEVVVGGAGVRRRCRRCCRRVRGRACVRCGVVRGARRCCRCCRCCRVGCVRRLQRHGHGRLQGRADAGRRSNRAQRGRAHTHERAVRHDWPPGGWAGWLVGRVAAVRWADAAEATSGRGTAVVVGMRRDVGGVACCC